MPSFRITDPFPTYLDQAFKPASGGYLRFYAAGTTTAKDVYGDKAMTINNGPQVAIDTSGRTTKDIWGNGSYKVRLYDANNALIDEADNVEIPGGTGTTIPTLVAGSFLTNDGSNLVWSVIRQVPDPAGQSGKILGTDGTNTFWQAPPTVATPTTGSGSFNFGGILMQWGTGTAPASGTHTTGQAVSFPTVFTGTPFVSVSHPNSLCSNGFLGVSQPSSVTINGFTALFDVNEAQTGAGYNITGSVPFTWFAVGNKS